MSKFDHAAKAETRCSSERADCSQIPDGRPQRFTEQKRSAARILKSKLRFLAVVAVAVNCGCASTSTVSQRDFLREAEVQDENSYPKYTYYCGSKNGYDYFAIDKTSSTTWSARLVRVAENEGTVSSRFVFSQDSLMWRPFAGFLWGPKR